MLTQAFNCPQCKWPFHRKEGEPRTPVFSTVFQAIRCRTCSRSPDLVAQRGLMAFLDQPAFKQTLSGYNYTLPINDPNCFGCEKSIKVFEGGRVYPGLCGHYLCWNCNNKRIFNGPISCVPCGINSDKPNSYADDRLVADFSKLIKSRGKCDELNELLAARQKEIEAFKAIEAKTEELRRCGALKKCMNCDSEQPVERLYNCNECKLVICGGCSFDSHQGHAVVKLLGIELDLLGKNNDKKYEEIFGGLRGNLKHIQTTIDEAVSRVMIAGKYRLTKVTKCSKYLDAQKIVAKVDNAADKFEKHCEVYIPVARELATQLTELSEEMMNDEE